MIVAMQIRPVVIVVETLRIHSYMGVGVIENKVENRRKFHTPLTFCNYNTAISVLGSGRRGSYNNGLTSHIT